MIYPIYPLRCFGRTIEGSGLDDAWQEADLYSSVTVAHILNGNHYNRATEAHRVNSSGTLRSVVGEIP